MHELSVLVVHGAIIAPVLVVAVTVAWLALIWRARTRRNADAADRELEARLVRVGGLTDGAVTLRGTLHEDDRGRWLDCAGHRVELSSTTDVVWGVADHVAPRRGEPLGARRR